MIAGLCAGFTALTALVFGYFLAQGALDEMYFYAWTYNLVYYGPETTLPDRLNSAAAFGQLLWQQYAVIAVILVLGLGSRLLLLAQQRPTEQESTARPAALYNLVWLVLSLAAAASAGRVYGHYYLQLLPSVSLLAGLQLAEWQQALAGGRLLPKLVRVGLLLAAAWTVTVGAARGFWPAEPYLDSGLAPARVVSQVTERHERIFVWGYSPDFYLFADRRPASRFIYCSFQTGLVPWTNTAPGLDTRYASVSGTMATLLSDLTRELPACFIDTSLSAYRKFDKYPIDEFHALRDLVQQNYVVIQPTAFEPHGFRLHLLKDRARRTPVPLAGGTPAGLEPPVVSGPQQADLTTTSYLVRASHRHGGLQRIEFLVNDQPVDAVSFLPVAGLEVRFVVEFGRMPAGRYRLAARATGADGETVTGPEVVVESAGNSLPASKLATFRLPTVEPGVLPLTGRSTYGADARMEAGKLVFSAHAPTTLAYPLDGRTTAVRGAFGFRPGAWAAENPGKTDGAEFIIRLVPPQGPTKVLLRQTLQPVEDPFARREQPFSLPLPAGFVGRLQFETNEGPAGNAASDWTYWSDLQLINSR